MGTGGLQAAVLSKYADASIGLAIRGSSRVIPAFRSMEATILAERAFRLAAGMAIVSPRQERIRPLTVGIGAFKER